jgi:tripartite-type tricarboxylate transporter receptor subunit TctC
MSDVTRRLALGTILYPFAIYPLYGDEPPEALAGEPDMRLIIPGPPGSTFDHYGRLIARHIGRHLPSRPVVVPRNIPGASGAIAANYLCNVAPKDGSVIGLVLKQQPMLEAIGERVPSRLQWIGSPARLPETLVVWHATGVRTIEAARYRVINLGVTTPSGASYVMPKLANEFAGTKFRIVTGYSSGPQLKLAMERGEVEAVSAEPWGEWKAKRPDWVREGKIVPILQMGMRKHPELSDVPLVTRLPMSETARAVFEIAAITSEISRPLVAPADVPPKRVAQLRAAFDATMTDPVFLADAARSGAEIDPISGNELAALVGRVSGARQDALDALRTAMTP